MCDSRSLVRVPVGDFGPGTEEPQKETCGIPGSDRRQLRVSRCESTQRKVSKQDSNDAHTYYTRHQNSSITDGVSYGNTFNHFYEKRRPPVTGYGPQYRTCISSPTEIGVEWGVGLRKINRLLSYLSRFRDMLNGREKSEFKCSTCKGTQCYMKNFYTKLFY